MAFADLNNLVDDLVRDDAGRISADEKDRAVQAAVTHYSVSNAKPAWEALTSNSDGYFDLPVGWVDDFSKANLAWYTDGGKTVKIATIETMNGLKLYAPELSMVSRNLTIGYTVFQDATDIDYTIPKIHEPAVAYLAAAFLLEQMSTATAGDQESTIQSDSVDHQSKTRDYASRAKKYRARFYELIAEQAGEQKAAGSVKTLDKKTGRGRSRLFHNRGL